MIYNWCYVIVTPIFLKQNHNKGGKYMAKFTKKAIIYEFMSILEVKSLDKITVKDICERCEINRNTFYYYFEDIYDVLNAVFEMEKESVLDEIKDNSSFMDAYRRSASIIMNNKKAVIHIYQSKRGDILRNYLEAVIKDFVGRAVEEAAEGYRLNEEDIRYITNFYAYAISGSTMRWIENGLPPYSEKLLLRVTRSFDATIQDLIEMCMDK